MMELRENSQTDVKASYFTYPIAFYKAASPYDWVNRRDVQGLLGQLEFHYFDSSMRTPRHPVQLHLTDVMLRNVGAFRVANV